MHPIIQCINNHQKVILICRSYEEICEINKLQAGLAYVSQPEIAKPYLEDHGDLSLEFINQTFTGWCYREWYSEHSAYDDFIYFQVENILARMQTIDVEVDILMDLIDEK